MNKEKEVVGRWTDDKAPEKSANLKLGTFQLERMAGNNWNTRA